VSSTTHTNAGIYKRYGDVPGDANYKRGQQDGEELHLEGVGDDPPGMG